ncbi:hypothetical protein PSR1_01358 [Anaeromyxobacter sp. PSR-1]|jgi:hypothetical protein|nr:hypothetical protein PSR1_01358 [Anaeromyxobacter sp. PSR-1]
MIRFIRTLARLWNALCELDARTALRPAPAHVRK